MQNCACVRSQLHVIGGADAWGLWINNISMCISFEGFRIDWANQWALLCVSVYMWKSVFPFINAEIGVISSTMYDRKKWKKFPVFMQISNGDYM